MLFSLPILLYFVICYEYSFHVNNYKLKHTKYINEQDMKDDLDKVNNYKRKLSLSVFLSALLISIPFMVMFFFANSYVIATICLVYVIAIVIANILSINLTFIPFVLASDGLILTAFSLLNNLVQNMNTNINAKNKYIISDLDILRISPTK